VITGELKEAVVAYFNVISPDSYLGKDLIQDIVGFLTQCESKRWKLFASFPCSYTKEGYQLYDHDSIRLSEEA
jgi:hypothetical protein